MFALAFDAVQFKFDRVDQAVSREARNRACWHQRVTQLGNGFDLFVVERQGDALAHLMTPKGVAPAFDLAR